MLEQVSENEIRRACNIIWSGAGSHDFQPDFKAFDSDGTAELYLNCIAGALRKHYDYSRLEPVLLWVQSYEDCATYEGLIWLALENCVFLRELPLRPALRELRLSYAERILRETPVTDDSHVLDYFARAHFSRVLGIEPKLTEFNREILSALEPSAEPDAVRLAESLTALLSRLFLISPNGKPRKLHRGLTVLRSPSGKKERQRFRPFLLGFAEHPENIYGGTASSEGEQRRPIASKLSPVQLREFIRYKYGRPCLAEREISELEKQLCRGSNEDCHLHFTRGEPWEGKIHNGFEALQKQKEAAQMQRNRDSYRQNIAVNRTAVNRLTSNIRNAVLMYLESNEVRSQTGTLNSPIAWRASVLEDERVFTRSDRDSVGGLSVDLLLDASGSQRNRQETVAAQAYIIAESLTACGIPCRVSSFCSMTGYTILHIYRSYNETSKNDSIFDYVSNGCNRDGLGISAVSALMLREPYEHRLLIILSDVKPNDVVKIRSESGEYEDYALGPGVNDTARRVRTAIAGGISVVCLFTGEDSELPDARLIYGSGMTRIASMDRMADAVGRIIVNAIREM